jgi:hypothetical protein
VTRDIHNDDDDDDNNNNNNEQVPGTLNGVFVSQVMYVLPSHWF